MMTFHDDTPEREALIRQIADRADFREWSGGFDPEESETEELVDYLTTAKPTRS